MKRLILAFFIATISMNAYSQIGFEQGYYIDNSGARMDGLIENREWENNPSEIRFKGTEALKEQTLRLEDVAEFGISNETKYVRKQVRIDRSSGNLRELSNARSPEFVEKLVFLQVLVEGKASLYYYADGRSRRYFFDTPGSPPEQLVYKKYKTSDNRVGFNQYFKQQLINGLQCKGSSTPDFENLEYQKKSLVNVFLWYNTCSNVAPINFVQGKNKMQFKLNVRPGLNLSSLIIANPELRTDREIDFGSDLSFRFGMEAEVVLGFNKNKWALLVEPVFQSYNSEVGDSKVKYNSFEVPFGLRHYMFLNQNSKFFVNASLVVGFGGNSRITRAGKADLHIEPAPNLAFGAGFKYRDKISVETRLHTGKQIFEYVFWHSRYDRVSLILGYSLF